MTAPQSHLGPPDPSWLPVIVNARTLRNSAADRALAAQAMRRLELRLAVGIAAVVGGALAWLTAVQW